MNRILTFMMLILLCSCSRTPQLQRLPSDAVVLAFGDSITFGTGVPDSESYPNVLEKLIGRRVVNAGVPGEVTAEGKARLPVLFDQHNPALILLCLGGNDFLRHEDEKRTLENLREMLSLARSRGIGVLLIGVPMLGFGLDVPKFYRELAREFTIPLEDKALKHILSNESLKSDPIHPNAMGYRILAEKVAEILRKSGAI
ncbi:arylesterase [Geobacter sp. OR-1]|uniref:arylesterase n=1 Tax=Geobacter sp. OR-1 TaxID=1266765 RepID=UPI0005440276|nr:arylesterase [Geobacter sp. OR-1]GAM11099.1 arylesterase [Geobacter sp. OR-1]